MITALDVKNKIIELVEAQPDFMYVAEEGREGSGNGCFYVQEDGVTGDCLFGQALIALGVPASTMSNHEGQNISKVLAHLGVKGDVDLIYSFDEVQSAQDSGYSWRVCLEALNEDLVTA